MNTILSIALILVLLALGGLHLYWGLGGRWPGHDETSLRLMVVGSRGARMYGLGPSAAVAFALASAAAIVALRQAGVTTGFPGLIVFGGYAVLIAVFAGRGLAPYVSPAFDYARGTPFFDLNRQIYAPLCLAIAAGLIATYPPALTRVFAA